ncbi:MAG: EI24 domain-containing protein [Deltaproteobacteria bacterium]|nr:EI24 domain-containing protein [Deltaproteobacteria bacterium]
MNIILGIRYNFRGLLFGIKTPRLLFWGMLRFGMVILITIALATVILIYHRDIMDLIWSKPASLWVLWFWYVLSWLLSLFLIGISAILSYLISQILFSALIMDYMSRITQIHMAGGIREAEPGFSLKFLLYLITQEIPRVVIPILLSLILMLAGWLTPLGPILAIVSSCLAATFLAWDNTDLIPARHMIPFKDRFHFLLRTLPFHIGFGLPFLIPGLNILLLSFAPVGATLYQMERKGNDTPVTGRV